MAAMWLCSSGASTRAHGEVEGGQQRQAEGANQQAEGIEPADGRGAEEAATRPAISTTYLPVCQRL